jgi:DNA modification methylase
MLNDLINTIQNIDCLEGFKKIPDRSIDLVLTDPPYGLNKQGIKNDHDLSLFWNFVLYCPNGRVMSPIGFTKYMSCVVFKKGNPKMVKRSKDIFVDTPGKMVEPDEGFINHPTPKPKTFIKEILNMFSKEGDIVLDPFIGSGSTAVACKILKRNYIGFDINNDYCKLSENRISKF